MRRHIAYRLRMIARWLDPNPSVITLQYGDAVMRLPRYATVEDALHLASRLEEFVVEP